MHRAKGGQQYFGTIFAGTVPCSQLHRDAGDVGTLLVIYMHCIVVVIIIEGLKIA